MFILMMTFALTNGLMSGTSGVDTWGHFGGFLAGLLLTSAIYPPALDLNKKLSTKLRLGAKIMMGCLIFALTVAVFTRPLTLCQPESICKNIC